MEDRAPGTGLVVTISAAYGAGGSVVAPRLAQRLGVRFVDRITPDEVREVIDRAGRAYQHEDAYDDTDARSALNRFLGHLGAGTLYGTVSSELAIGFDDELRRTGEAPIWGLVREGGGVVLGRAAEAAVGTLVPALHVRLDGPHERKVRLAVQIDGIEQEAAEQNLVEADRAREAYARRLYGIDPTDRSRYHLVIDPTSLGVEATVETIRAAAQAYRSITAST